MGGVASFFPPGIRLWAWLAALAVLSSLAIACADEDLALPPAVEGSPAGASAGAAAFPATVRDSAGTDVRLERMPQRIVSLSPGATEVLFAIGAGTRVVGTDQFSNYPPEATKTTKLDYSSPSAEAVVALQPDLVILATRQQAHVEQLRRLGLTVLFAREPENLEGVYGNIELLGRLTGQTTEAARVVADMRREVDAVTAAIADITSGPRVFFELDPTLFTAAPNTFIGSMLSMLKARNIAPQGSAQFPQLTAEAVLSADPEVVLLSHPGTTAEVGTRPGWSNVSAVRNGRVVSIEADLVNRPGPRLAQGIRLLGRALYPDRVR
ncbi:MAG: ABC transporter substrate-binding protein [Dehalococcoidia bacterium]|nr:ABC transporter substrate-binding protein [Dehalococcoidia bacterium]